MESVLWIDPLGLMNGRKRRRLKHLVHVLTRSALCSSTTCSFQRSHIQFEHLSKWSPRHSCVRGYLVDVEIPDEMNQFAELKTLTENVGLNERCISSAVDRASEWRKTGPMEGGRSQPGRRGAQPRNEVKKKHRTWTRRSKRRNGGRSDGPDDFSSAIEAHRTAQVT